MVERTDVTTYFKSFVSSPEVSKHHCLIFGALIATAEIVPIGLDLNLGQTQAFY